MVSKTTTRVATPRGAASAYAKAAPQAQPAPEVAKPAPRRMAGGFWLGFLLVIVALMLMLGKTVLDFFTVTDVATIKTQHTEAFKRTQAHLDTWRSEEAAYAADLPIYDHNPTTGNPSGPTVVEFIDLGCVPCRGEIQRLTALRQQYAPQAQFVTKLLPDRDRPLSAEAAIFARIAQDHNKFWQFRDTVATTNQDGVAYYLSVLEGLGIPLRDIRQGISRNQEAYLAGLRQDTALATELNLSTPTHIFVNGHRLGQPGLAKTDAEAILIRAIAGQPLVALE